MRECDEISASQQKVSLAADTVLAQERKSHRLKSLDFPLLNSDQGLTTPVPTGLVLSNMTQMETCCKVCKSTRKVSLPANQLARNVLTLLNRPPSSAQLGTPSQAAVCQLHLEQQRKLEAASPSAGRRCSHCHSLQVEQGCMCPAPVVLHLQEVSNSSSPEK